MKKVRLGDIATVITKGTTPTTLGYNFVDDGVNFVKIESITENGEFLTDKFAHITDECDRKLSRSQLQRNDLLFSIAGAIGRTAIVTEEILPANTNQALAIIRVPEGVVDYSYLKYVLQSPTIVEQFEKKKQGVAQLNISLKDIGDFVIPLRIAEEQKSIVTTMDKVSGLIALRKEQLAKLNQLVKSRFIELFGDPITNPMGWKLHRFDSLCENLDSRRKPITASEREAGVYPYYGASGIVDYVAGYLFDENILLVSEDGANLLMRSTPIAFSVSGKVWVNNHAHVVRFEKMSMQKYIEVFFSLIDISDHITGSAQPKLNQAKLNAMMFPVPSEERLDAFLQFIEQTDKSKLAIQQSLDKLELLKKSLMQEYFG